MAELLAKGVPLFLRPDLEEAEEVMKQLKIAAEMGPTVGIGLYLGLTKKGPKRKFSEFLETVIRLPSFEKLGHLKNRLGNDCLKWAEELDEQQQGVIHHVDDISYEDFEEKFRELNPKLDFENKMDFFANFSDIVKEAQQNGFKLTNYHRLLLNILGC